MMRVAVDPDLCQGHGVCEAEAPAVFALGKRPPVELLDDRPPEAARAGVEGAVRYCPTHAITVHEEE